MKLRTYHDLDEPDRSDLGAQVAAQRQRVDQRLSAVRHVVAVASGKGGVGKSFVTAGLALALAPGWKVGVLDADLGGPTTARMLGCGDGPVAVTEDGAVPQVAGGGLRVMSSDLLLKEGSPLTWKGPDSHSHVWRGTLEAGMLREFLADVTWGQLDVLLVDLPPGTDRLTTLVELVPRLSALAVTIPSDASLRAVSRSLAHAREAGIGVLGIVENMAGYVCGHCGHTGTLFGGDAAGRLSSSSGAPVLARLPLDPALQAEADAGRMTGNARALEMFSPLAQALMERLGAT